MFLDLFLISQAESLANGRYIHKVKNMVAAYRTAYELSLDGSPEYIEIFEEAQKNLQQFINRRKSEKTDPDDYDLDILKND
jgi:hypothetical protein